MSHAVKRITAELKDQQKNPSVHFSAAPIDNDLFDWHFTIAGPEGTAYENGLYHGRIILSTSYPLKPPKFLMMTPNGRFEIYKEICMSMTDYHPEAWNPSWSIRSMLEAVVSFLPEDQMGVGSIQVTDSVRKKFAQNSRFWRCERCAMTNDQIWVTHEQTMKAAKDLFTKKIDEEPEQIVPEEEKKVEEPPPEEPQEEVEVVAQEEISEPKEFLLTPEDPPPAPAEPEHVVALEQPEEPPVQPAEAPRVQANYAHLPSPEDITSFIKSTDRHLRLLEVLFIGGAAFFIAMLNYGN